MPLPRPIAASQTDAKSPVDQNLMDSIREDLDYLQSTGGGGGGSGGGGGGSFKVNGYLSFFARNPFQENESHLRPAYRLDGIVYASDATLRGARGILEDAGDGGTLEIDVLKYSAPNAKITGVQKQFSAPITTVSRAGSGLTTQSVARVGEQLATQSIVKWKSDLAIQAILPYGFVPNQWLIVLGGEPDAEYIIGASVFITGATTPVNNQTATILRRKVDGQNNLVVQSSTMVLQNAPAGSLTLAAFKLTYINPVPSYIAPGEEVKLSGHTAPANNGNVTVAFTNRTGNNIIIYAVFMVEQGAPAGVAETNRFVYSLSAAAPTDYVVGETVTLTAHTNANNNGVRKITNVNMGGNNLVVYNKSGATQGSGGTINSNRWVYSFSVDPVGKVAVGDRVDVRLTTLLENQGVFEAKEINRAAGLNVVVFNELGAPQASAAGVFWSLRTLVKFAAAQPSITTNSVIEVVGTYVDATYAGDERSALGNFQVLEVNRGGGSNYNAVIETRGPEYLYPLGRVTLEGKSIFDVKPSAIISDAVTGGVVTDAGVVNDVRANVVAGDLIMCAITKFPKGAARNLTIQLV